MPEPRPWRAYLIDEDLPRSLATDLRTAGLDAEHVTEAGLRGAADSTLRNHARQRGLIIVSRDLGMINIRRDDNGPSPGFVLVRLPHMISIADLKSTIVTTLVSLSQEPPTERVAVIEPGRVRLRP